VVFKIGWRAAAGAKVRLWVVMAAIAVGAVEMAAAQWLGDYLGGLHYVRVWYEGRWVSIHPGAWPNHPLNPDRRHAKQ
jgi:hypothetical protein